MKLPKYENPFRIRQPLYTVPKKKGPPVILGALFIFVIAPLVILVNFFLLARFIGPVFSAILLSL